ncbi:MAG: hypothetical protein ACE5HJ_07020 [Thermoplasmata archaeon]
MRGHLLSVVTLLSVATAVRLLQLLLSSLPLNIDSFAQLAIAREVLGSGQWTLDETSTNAYNLKMPYLPILLATASAVTAMDPLGLATPLMILVSLIGILGFYALTYALTRQRLVAVSSSLVLALLGPYIFLSSTLIKEALALALLPTLLWLTIHRRDPRRRAMAATLLLILPLIHHLSTLMAYGLVTLVILLQNVQAYRGDRWSWRALGWDLLLGPALFPFALWYYTSVRMEFFTQVWNPNEVALFMSTALLMTAAALFLTSERRARPWFILSKSKLLPSLVDQKAIAIVGAFMLVLANFYRPLFPGTVLTSPTLLLIAFAYLPLAFLALVGFNVHRLSSGRRKVAPAALILAPLTVILYALLRGLDPLSHVLVYRSVDFLDYGLALSIGIALSLKMSRLRRSSLSAIVIVSLLVTLPLAYSTEEVLQVQNTTYEYELAAMRHISQFGLDSTSTDQRTAAVMSMYFGLQAESSLPFKIAQGRPPGPGNVLLLEDNWRTRGAQVHPLPFLLLDEDSLSQLVDDNQLLYHGGDSANYVYLVLMRG